MSDKAIKIGGYLPLFPGFYDTIYDPDGNVCECTVRDDLEDVYGICIDEDDVDLWEFFNTSGYEKDVSEAVFSVVTDLLTQKGYVQGGEPEELVPSNGYINDSVNTIWEITDKNIKKIRKDLKENARIFEDYICERYRSCDGYWSWYSDDYEEWISDFHECEHMFSSAMEFLLSRVHKVTECDVFEKAFSENDMSTENYFNLEKIKAEAEALTKSA